MEFVQVTYQVQAPESEWAAWAQSLLLEQTVETPEAVALRYPSVRDGIMGRVGAVAPSGANSFRVTLEIPTTVARQGTADLLNVLFGNASLHPQVALVDFELPDSLLSDYAGPRFGITGLRDLVGVADRPLTCSSIKPIGLSVDALATLCRDMALGGVDFIKDDHYLGDHSFCPFEERVRACLQSVGEARARTSRHTVYIPHLSGPPDAVRRQAEIAREVGVEAVMMAPMLLGLPVFREIVDRNLDVPVLAHPSFAGTLRIADEMLYGKLFRLLGADAVIFANYGGRFSTAPEGCRRIAGMLRAPFGRLRPSLPVPAGGMTVSRVPELVRFFGADAMLLIGGSLLEAGDALADRTRAFTEAVERTAREGGLLASPEP